MESKSVSIPKMACGHCLMTIKREVSELPGVQSVEGDVAGKRITIQWEAPATWQQIADTLQDAGYPAA